MVAGNVYTALKHVVTGRRCRMERILLHSVCDCGGTIHHRKAKKEFMCLLLLPSAFVNGCGLNVQARSLKLSNFGRGTIRSLAQSWSGWLGAWRVRPTSSQPGSYYQQSDFLSGFAGLLLERLAPEACGSGIPNVRQPAMPINLTWRVASVKLVTAIIALGSG